MGKLGVCAPKGVLLRTRLGAVAAGLVAAGAFMFASAKASACTIVVGNSGDSQTITGTTSSILAAAFIRSTSGNCMYRVFNGANFSGRSVVIGTALSGRIRAGTDGVENRDSGGGETWGIRSIQFIPFSTSEVCTLRIGGNGVRMTYTSELSQIEAMPGMEKIDWLSCWTGVNGRATLFNHSNFVSPQREVLAGAGASTLPFRARSLRFSSNTLVLE